MVQLLSASLTSLYYTGIVVCYNYLTFTTNGEITNYWSSGDYISKYDLNNINYYSTNYDGFGNSISINNDGTSFSTIDITNKLIHLFDIYPV